MQDSNDTADDSIVSSRRSVLAATFGLPVVGSIGVGAADTVRRLGNSGLASMDSANGSDSAASVTVDFATGRHPVDEDRYTQVTIDPELLEALDVSVGDQIRLDRDGDHALYTVAAAMTERDASTIRMNRRARARLDLENTAWAEVGDFGTGCPELLGTSELVDDVFEAVADPAVVSDASIEEAQADGDLVEDAGGEGTDLAILAPHGGDIEPHTAEQARSLHDVMDHADGTYDHVDTSYWCAQGYAPDGGAFLRWHVPSAAISPASFPELEAFDTDSYSYAVSFHGICTNQIRVGGSAPERIKQRVVDSLNYELPSSTQRAVIANGRFSAQSEDVLVNTVGTNGVWVGQPPEVRAGYAGTVVDAVADGISDAFEDSLGPEA